MFNPWIALASALTAYLVGSFSFARLFTRIFAPGRDLEQVEIGPEGYPKMRLRTAGSTTASMVLGAKKGYLVAVCDILKGLLPVLAFRLLFPQGYYHLIAAFFVTVGHDWPFYHRFRGGGGLSTTLGGFFVVDWLGTLASIVASFFLGTFVIRLAPVGFMAVPWFMLLWLAIFKGDWPHILYGIAMPLVMSLATLPDILGYIRKRRDPTRPKEDISDQAQMIPMYRFMASMLGRGKKK